MKQTDSRQLHRNNQLDTTGDTIKRAAAAVYERNLMNITADTALNSDLFQFIREIEEWKTNMSI